jgi:hypothetical protein
MPQKNTAKRARRSRRAKAKSSRAPRIALKATRYSAVVGGRRRTCPKYAINAPATKRQKSLACYVRLMGRTRKYRSPDHAAKAKKARLNVLRMYRKNSDKPACRRITQDMRFLDREFVGGKTSAMC